MGRSGNNNFDGNIFSKTVGFNTPNPFEAASNSFTRQNLTPPTKRLNGYDSTILNKTNFDQTQEPELNINYRVKEKETALKDLDEKIKFSETYGTANESLSLKAKRQRIMQELDTLKRQQAYPTNISNSDKFLYEQFKQKMPVLYKINDFISRNILAKVSKKINSIVTLNDSLEQLADISKSVDELVDMNIPYGEKSENYEKLAHYISRANAIHSKISKSLRK